MTRAMFQMKVGRRFDFAGNELKNSREPFLTSYRFLDSARNDRCEYLPLAMTPSSCKQ